MRNLFRFILTLLLFIPFIGFSQVPAAPSNGLWGIIASQYQVGTTAQGTTQAKITLQNTTLTKFAGVQFRVFYDNIAFTNATVTLIGSSTNLDLQYITNTVNGYITVTLSYTGPSAAYTIPNGEKFLITFTHAPASTFNNLASISNLTWTGVQTFTPYAAKQDGMDTTLSVHNYGGVFTPVNFAYHGTFTNVTGTGAKTLTLALEKKPLGSNTWTQHSIYTTDNDGDFAISVPLDTTFWDVRLAVQGDTMGVGNVISSTDAQLINQWVLGNGTMTGFNYYTADVNDSYGTTISDVWGVFGRVSGRFTQWPNNTKDVKFFTSSQYTTINGSATNYTSTIAGVTNFTFDILPGQPDSVVYYVMVPGDANGTGYHMARVTPIEVVVGPAPGLENQIYNVIDTKVEYDFPTQSIEVNVPHISVQAGNLVELPVKVNTNGVELSSLQFGFKYDDTLLEFKGIISSAGAMKWISYVNPNDSEIDWGGFDPTNNTNTLKDGDKVVTLQFLALQPQNLWEASPLYTTRKFAGNTLSKDLTLTPTNGILQVLKMEGGEILNGNNMEVYPNPYQNEVTITFKVEETTNATLSIYDIVGRKLVTILDTQIPNGVYNYTKDLGQLVPGVYVVKLTVENGVSSFERIVKQ
tara:strand:+ start:370 stop:2280 length:1911 start_codon:yes stop_codon:yes gene_type:complete